MKAELRGRSRPLAIACGFASLLAALIFWVDWDSDGRATTGAARPFPLLFGESRSCSTSRALPAQSRRAEQQARLLLERYPYDPLDGVRAALRFSEAGACYRAAGLNADAERAETSERAIKARVRTDYASSRLALRSALEREEWSFVGAEGKRLLRFTFHAQEHDYVEWLTRLVGKAASRARTHP